MASALPNRDVSVMPTVEESRSLSAVLSQEQPAPISGGEMKQDAGTEYNIDNVSESRFLLLVAGLLAIRERGFVQ